MGLLMERWMADPLTQCLGKCTHSELVDPGEWRVALNSHIQSTPPPPPRNTATLGTDEKAEVLENGGKVGHI